MFAAFCQALVAEKVYPESVFTGTSHGVAAHLTPAHFSIGNSGTALPTVQHIECVATVKLEGQETGELKPPPGDVFLFPLERGEIERMKKGRRYSAVVPVLPDLSDRLKPGASVTFFEATANPLADPVPVPEGDRITVTLTKVEDVNYPWAGRQIYSIAWDPDQAMKKAVARTQRSE